MLSNVAIASLRPYVKVVLTKMNKRFGIAKMKVRRCSLTPGWKQLTPRVLSALEIEI